MYIFWALYKDRGREVRFSWMRGYLIQKKESIQALYINRTNKIVM